MIVVRKIVALLLLTGILANCFNYAIVSTSYQLNKEYIASVLCTNKDKPELHCDGKCFLDIKLKELEQKNKQEQENLKKLVETIIPEHTTAILPLYEIPNNSSIPFYLQQKPIGKVNNIFHPPKLG
ncbi:hypothetical protein [Pedobacter sp.]|uniref:hypothetical protein n=1 Tax=Pedobacter sp. TaxID=1411316 RepID=UPI00396C920A